MKSRELNRPESPAEVLRARLRSLGLTQSQLAGQLQISAGYLSDVLASRRRITPQLALDLEQELGIPAQTWVALQGEYELEQARLQRAARKDVRGEK